MSDDLVQVREGRVWFQLNELESYDIVQCSGLSDWNKPRGAVTPIRCQSFTTIGEEDVMGYQRASKDMSAFTITSRLRELQNFLFSLNCDTNVQVLIKDCGDPNDYYGYKLGLGWVRCPPGDLSGDPMALIEGDNVAVNIANPFNAVYGPYLIDFKVGFMSQRTLAETGAITDISMFAEECLQNCLFHAGNGQYGYCVAEAQPASIVDAANVWYTEDYADNWALVSANPFAAGEDISCVVKTGTVTNHRVIVSRGEADAGNPAEIAYADCTSIGQTAWVNVDVGTVNGQYITYMSWPVYNKLFAITNDGYIYRSEDGGATWAVSYQHTAAVGLNDISVISRGYGWVVGDVDLLVYTADYGESWTVVDGPNDGLLNLNTCYLSIDRKLLLGDSAGMAHGTTDEAVTWSQHPMQGIVATSVVRIRGSGTHWLWAIANMAPTAPATHNSRVVRSTDGGASWRLWQLAQNITPNYGLNALAVVDPNRVLVGGNPYPAGDTAFFTRTDTNIDKLI